MMYTAVNLRPHLAALPPSPIPPSFLFVALAYFNIVLPSFIPSTCAPSAVFWNRARAVKAQSIKYLSSPMLTMRAYNTSKERERRAITFAKQDDGILAANATSSGVISHAAIAPSAPSIALIGLSLLGNLDDIYQASDYPSITLTYNVGHTRKGPGGMLMFTHTFRGKFYLTFGWDKAGFKEGVVEHFWNNVQEAVDEFLLDERRVEPKL